MNKLNILLLGAGNRVSLCEYIINAGIKRNVDVSLFSLEKEYEVPISKLAHIIKGLKWTDPFFELQLHDTIRTHKINIVIPLMDGATVALANSKHYTEELFANEGHKVWCMVSRYDLCDYFNDKLKSDEWFNRNNILIPKLNPITFPRIYKLQFGYGSRNQIIINNNNELDLFLKSTKIPIDQYIVQQVIPGTEYTVDAYVNRNGELVGAVSRKRLLVINGEVNRSVTSRDNELNELVIKILTKTEAKNRLEGPITLQFIKSSEDNRLYMVEINPRFGGGVICSLKAGADFTECMVAEFLGEELPDCTKWEENLLMMRANQEIWNHGYNN